MGLKRVNIFTTTPGTPIPVPPAADAANLLYDISSNSLSAVLAGGTINPISSSSNSINVSGGVLTVLPGTNILTGGTAGQPIISVVPNPQFSTIEILQPNTTGGTPITFILTGGANINLAINTEVPGAIFDFSAEKKWTGGSTFPEQSEILIKAPTYDNILVTNTSTVTIDNAPQMGLVGSSTNIATALRIKSGGTRIDNGTLYIGTFPDGGWPNNSNPIAGYRNSDDSCFMEMTNGFSGTSALAGFSANNDLENSTVLGITSSGFSNFGFTPDTSFLGAFGSGGLTVRTFAEAPILFSINSTEAMRISSGRSIGIGTSNPSRLLDVNGDQRLNGNLFITSHINWVYVLGVSPGNFETGRDSSGDLVNNVPTGANQNFTIQGASSLFLKSGGNNGMGTVNPSAKLTISGATGYDQLNLTASYTPTSTADSNGHQGDIAWDANFIYVKTGAGWKRSALSTF